MTTIMSILGKRFADHYEFNEAQKQFVTDILKKDLGIPFVSFRVIEEKKLIIVSAFAEENGQEYFIRPKKDPFKKMIDYMQLTYHMRFSRRDNNDEL